MGFQDHIVTLAAYRRGRPEEPRSKGGVKTVTRRLSFSGRPNTRLVDAHISPIWLPAGSMERLRRMADAVNAPISPIGREFLGHERLVGTLHGAVKPEPAALEFPRRVAFLAAIANAIRAKLNPNTADITGVDRPAKPAPVLDLSKIDFEALRSRYKESKHQNTDLEVLKAAIRAQLEKLIRLNKTRSDKFEERIECYNTGGRNIARGGQPQKSTANL